MITRTFKLCLNAGTGSAPYINVSQYDEGETWLFELYSETGERYIPTTGAIVGVKSDGHGIANTGTVDSEGRVVIAETQQMTAAAGKAEFELLIENQTHGTANFVVDVEQRAGENAVLSESDLSLLQEAIDATSPLPTGGTVGQVLTKTENGSAWSNAGTPTQEQVADAVSDWADEHITVETGVVIDTSLSVAGAAADAKKTGDEISDLKSDLKQTYNVLLGDTNLLEFQANSRTVNGITFTENVDGTVTANGTATANAIYGISFSPVVTGLYHLSGCPSGGGSTQYYQRINSVTGNDTGSGVDVELVAGTDYSVWIVVVNGRTVNNINFTPTLILKSESILSVLNIANMSPFKAQTPPLFEGGYYANDGQVYHDSNETWLKTRVRTNIVYVKSGAVLRTESSSYQLTVCRYADYEPQNYIETLLNQSAVKKWECPTDGYYSITFKRLSGSGLAISTIRSDFDFSDFYIQIDDRIHISWIGSGISAETSTYTDSGDCAMVVFPNGEGLLIDSANSRNYGSVRKRLAESGFYHIKNIIISHFHADHVGGLLTMVNDNLINIDGATVYLPDYNATLWAYNNNVMEPATKTLYDNAMSMFANKNCNLIYPDTDFEPYEIGDAVLSFFNTDMSVYEGVSANYNDWSLCNYIFYGNVNICFSGDLGPIAQGHVGGTLYKSNIYKADHHGWLNQTSIPSNYINNVSPDVIIAMDGQVHDSYLGTDTAPLVKWADKNGVAYYRKYTNGEIKMAVSKEAWEFESKVTRYELPNA